MAQRDCDGLRIRFLSQLLLKPKARRHHAVFDLDLAAAVLVDAVEEKALDPPLVQHHLLGAADVGNGAVESSLAGGREEMCKPGSAIASS